MPDRARQDAEDAEGSVGADRVARLDTIRTLVTLWVEDGIVPGVALAVSQHGHLVMEVSAGRLAAGSGAPVETGTLYPLGTLTMPFTAMAYLRLVERGEAWLDESVRRLIPAFATGGPAEQQEAGRDLTLRDLLLHATGLPPEQPDAAGLAASEASFGEWVAAAAGTPLDHPPGQVLTTSIPGAWLIGGAIAAITGSTFAEVLQGEVLDRAGLRDTVLTPGAVPSDTTRIARRYGRDRLANTAYGRALGSPATGLFATARDLLRLAGILLNDGRDPEGRTMLSRASVALLTTPQTPGGRALPGRGVGQFPPERLTVRGLGWEINHLAPLHPAGWAGDLASPRAFGQLGEPGVLLWADPPSGTACALLANRDLATAWTRAPARWARLANAIVAALAGGATVASRA